MTLFRITTIYVYVYIVYKAFPNMSSAIMDYKEETDMSSAIMDYIEETSSKGKKDDCN